MESDEKFCVDNLMMDWSVLDIADRLSQVQLNVKKEKSLICEKLGMLIPTYDPVLAPIPVRNLHMPNSFYFGKVTFMFQPLS